MLLTPNVPIGHSAARPSGQAWSRLALILFCTVIVSNVIEAPLRYGLSLIGASSAIYFRDLFAGGVVFITVLAWMSGDRSKFPFVIVLYLIGLHFFVGVLNLGSIIQPIIGFKVLLSLLMGICLSQALLAKDRLVLLWCYLLLFVVLAGVAINYNYVYPWAGAVLSSAIGDGALTREWTAGGVRRIAGLSRASYDAASLILVLFVPVALHLRRRPLPLLVMYAASLAAVALTTSKGALLALGLFAPWFAVAYVAKRPAVATVVLRALFILGVALPLLSLLIDFRQQGVLGKELLWWISSFLDRLQRMWPDAFANVAEAGNLILGRGLGGIGFPQLFGEGSRYNSADNVGLYFYSAFGLLGLVYLAVLLQSCARLQNYSSNNILRASLPGWGFMWFAYGLTTSMLEQAVFAAVAGFALGTFLLKSDDAP